MLLHLLDMDQDILKPRLTFTGESDLIMSLLHEANTFRAK